LSDQMPSKPSNWWFLQFGTDDRLYVYKGIMAAPPFLQVAFYARDKVISRLTRKSGSYVLQLPISYFLLSWLLDLAFAFLQFRALFTVLGYLFTFLPKYVSSGGFGLPLLSSNNEWIPRRAALRGHVLGFDAESTPDSLADSLDLVADLK